MTTELRTTGDHNALACATLIDEWIRLGVRHAVVSPGSRSTPLAVAVADRAELAVHIVHDERAAAFVALGLGLAGTPALVICTSGTAAANYHPAVVEAGLSDVAMLILTADRPPELRNVGAPQTIDQIGLYTTSVRAFVDAPVPDEADTSVWRSLARAMFDATQGRGTVPRYGPAHLNLPFREPLLGTPGQLPAPLAPTEGTVARPVAPNDIDAVVDALDRPRGVIVAGGRSGVDGDTIMAVASQLEWPVLADPCSGLRDRPRVITAFDSILRVGAFADSHLPDVVLRFGRVPASKFLSQWTARTAVVQVGGPGVIEPEHNVVCFSDAPTLVAAADVLPGRRGATPAGWNADWQLANQAAEQAIVTTLDSYSNALTEPAIARVVVDTVAAADDAELVVSSSMPIRDVEWYGGPRANAHANRGANGIDGVTSTAIGRALAGRTVFELVGDIAFVHDSSALVALAQRAVDLRIIVIDNDGGGIFGFLPQRNQLSAERFEQLFGTPHGTDIGALGAAHHLPVVTATTLDELRQGLDAPGPRIVCVTTDRTANLDVHRRLNDAVAAAISRLGNNAV